MSAIISDIKDDLQKLEELKRKIGEVKQELMSIDVRIEVDRKNSLEGELKNLNAEYRSVTKNISQAEGEILKASKSVDTITEKIINQKGVVKDVEADVKRLAEAYRSALKRDKYGSGGTAELAEYQAAKKILEEERTALFALTQEKARAQLKVKGLRDEYNAYRQSAKGATDTTLDLGKALNSIKGRLGGVLAGFGVQQLISDMIRVRGEFQQADTAIQTMLGSKAKADQLLAQVREYAKISPLEFSDITRATQMMLGFNIEADKVPGFIKAIGDVSMGESGRFNSLTLAFSQMSATGKLMGQDLNQMINAGFNPLSTMAEKSGKSIAQLKEEMSKGAITAEMVQQAFIDATSAGGKFYGMSENAAKTINGQLSMMHDAIDSALNEMGTASEGIIVKSIQGITSLIENYERVGKVIIGLAGTYGTYRAAVMLVAATEKIAALSRLAAIKHTNVLSLATKSLAAQTGILNAVMSANPYVIAATAIAGVVAVLWNMKSAEERVQDELDNYRQKRDEAIKKDEEHRQKIEELVRIAGDEQQATATRKEAMSLLIQQYPELFKEYNTEAEALQKIYEWKAKIAEIEGKKVSDRTANEITNLDKEISDLEEKSNKKRKVKKQVYNNQTLQWDTKIVEESVITQSERDRLKALKIERDKLKKDQQKQAATSYLSDLTNVSDTDLQHEIEERRKLLNYLKVREMKGSKNAKGQILSGGAAGIYNKEELEGQIQKFEWEQNRRKKVLEDSSKNFASEAEKAYKKESNALKKLQELSDPKKRVKSSMVIDKKAVKDMDEDEFLAAIKKQQKAVDDAKSKVDTYNKARNGGLSSNKANDEAKRRAEAEQRLAELVDKQKRDQARKAVDLEFSTREAEVKAMKDGTDKTLKQIALDQDREIEAIKRSYEDMRLTRIEEAKRLWETDPKNKSAKEKGRGFYDSAEFTEGVQSGRWENTKEETQNRDARITAVNQQADRQIEEQYRKRLQYQYDYLKEYGSLEEQRWAITQEYDKKIADASDLYEKASLQKEKDNKIKEINFKEIQQDINWEQVFNDLSLYSTETLKGLKEKLRVALDAKDITAENAKVIVEKINEIEDDIESRTDFWGGLMPYLERRKELTKEAYQWEQKLKDAQARQLEASVKSGIKRQDLQQAINKAAGKEVDLSQADYKNFDKYLTDALKLNLTEKQLEELRQKAAELVSVESEFEQATRDATNAQQGKAEADKNLNDKKGVGGFLKDSFEQGVAQAGGTGKYLLNQANELNELIDAVGLHDTEFGKGVQEFVGGVNHLSSAVQKFQNGDIIGGITDTILGVQDIGSLVERVGGFSFNGSNADEVNRANARLADINEYLSKNIEELTNEISKANGLDAVRVANNALDLQDEKEKNIRTQISNQMGYHGSHHSFGYYWDGFSEEEIKKVNDSLGKNSEKFTGNIRELTAEQAKAITMSAELSNKIKQTGYGGYGEQVYKYIEALAEEAGVAEEIQRALTDTITGTSFDSLRSSFLSTLTDMKSDAKDFSKSLEDMMFSAVINSNVLDEEFDDWLNKWQEQYSEAVKKNDYAAFERLNEESLKKREELIAKRDKIADAMKYTGETGSSSQQSASFNSAQNITYEQADALTGAILGHTMLLEQGNATREIISQNITVLTATAEDLKMSHANQSLALTDIQSILANSYLEHQEANVHLSAIEKAIVPMQGELSKIRKIVEENQ